MSFSYTIPNKYAEQYFGFFLKKTAGALPFIKKERRDLGTN
jgi:hypothetical protein